MPPVHVVLNILIFLLLDELPFYATTDERIVEIHGESLKVLKALESVIGHLRKFLVDHSVLPLFEKGVSFFFFPQRGLEFKFYVLLIAAN